MKRNKENLVLGPSDNLKIFTYFQIPLLNEMLQLSTIFFE